MLYTKELAEQLKKAINDVVVKAEDIVEDVDYTFDVIATTQDVDRDGEIILVDGWDTKNWLKNPVILANHNYTIESIIGKGYKFYKKDGVMRLKGVFSSTNHLGVLARQLYAEGMLQTVSVGFLAKKRNDQNYKIIEEAELLEVSFVAVPCNPNAVRVGKELLQEAIEKGLIIEQKEEIIEEMEVVDPTIKDVLAELATLKEVVQGLADDKVKKEQMEKEVLKAKEQKEFLQNINKATALALENLKKLSS